MIRLILVPGASADTPEPTCHELACWYVATTFPLVARCDHRDRFDVRDCQTERPLTDLELLNLGDELAGWSESMDEEIERRKTARELEVASPCA